MFKKIKLRKSKTLSLEAKEAESNTNKRKIVKSLSINDMDLHNINPLSSKNVKKNLLLDLDNEITPKIKLPRIPSSEQLIIDIKSKIALNKNLNFFITTEKGLKINKTDTKIKNYRRRMQLKKASHFGEFLNFNVFNEKDIEIKDLIDKFHKQMAKKRINKVQRRKNILNKLYGITPEYNKNLKTAKSQKNLSLEDYQDNILLALNSNGMYSDECMGQLYQKFKNIRVDMETVVPYPKINFNRIIKHFKNSIKRKNFRTMSVKDLLSKTKEPQDEFEKEEKKIIALKLKKNYNYHISRLQHDNLYILPVHIRKLFIK